VDLGRYRCTQHVPGPFARQPADDVGTEEDAGCDENAIPVDVEIKGVDGDCHAIRGLTGDQMAHVEGGGAQKKERNGIPIEFNLPQAEAARGRVAGHYSRASCCQT